MNSTSLKEAMAAVSRIMSENKDYLVELDQQNGDGDLGISMSGGFSAASDYLTSADETDLGKLFMKASSVFNESAPSSLGTILSLGMMGIARALKGSEHASLHETAEAMKSGLDKIMEKAGSKPGEKTILDSLCPAVDVLLNFDGDDSAAAFKKAAEGAKSGSESTRQMRSVHGRAAYYGDKSIGLLDGGSVVGRLIFEAISEYLN